MAGRNVMRSFVGGESLNSACSHNTETDPAKGKLSGRDEVNTTTASPALGGRDGRAKCRKQRGIDHACQGIPEGANCQVPRRLNHPSVCFQRLMMGLQVTQGATKSLWTANPNGSASQRMVSLSQNGWPHPAQRSAELDQRWTDDFCATHHNRPLRSTGSAQLPERNS